VLCAPHDIIITDNVYYVMQGQMQEAHRLGEQMLRQAQAQPDPAPRMLAHFQLGLVLFWQCEPAAAQTHHTQALTLYTPQEHRALAVRYGVDVGVAMGVAVGVGVSVGVGVAVGVGVGA